MKNISIFCCLLCMLFGISTYAQSRIGPPGSAASKNRHDNEEIINQFLKGMKRDHNSSPEIDGTPFLNEDPQDAQLIFPEYEPIAAKVHYNVMREEMQVEMEEGTYRVLHPDVAVILNGKEYRMLPYFSEEKSSNRMGYFGFLPSGQGDGSNELVLLEKFNKSIRRGKAAAAMQKATPPEYVTHDDYYLKFKDSQPVLVEGRRKKFLESFPEDHQKDLKRYMKENKLSPRNKEELQQIVRYYNQTF